MGVKQGFPRAGPSQRVPKRRGSSAPVPGKVWEEGRGLEFPGQVYRRWQEAKAVVTGRPKAARKRQLRGQGYRRRAEQVVLGRTGVPRRGY